jgi:hypothetical protein
MYEQLGCLLLNTPCKPTITPNAVKYFLYNPNPPAPHHQEREPTHNIIKIVLGVEHGFRRKSAKRIDEKMVSEPLQHRATT